MLLLSYVAFLLQRRGSGGTFIVGVGVVDEPPCVFILDDRPFVYGQKTSAPRVVNPLIA